MAIKSLLLAALLATANAGMTTLTLTDGSLSTVLSLPVWPAPNTTVTTTQTETISSGLTTTTTYITPVLPATTSTFTSTLSVTATVVGSTTTSIGSPSNGTTTGSGAAESSAYLSSVLSVETYTPTPVGATNATGTGAPSQYTGAAAPKGETKGSAWIAMVVFGAVGLAVL